MCLSFSAISGAQLRSGLLGCECAKHNWFFGLGYSCTHGFQAARAFETFGLATGQRKAGSVQVAAKLSAGSSVARWPFQVRVKARVLATDPRVN